MKKVRTFAHGKMAEWSNAAVLKTVDLHGSGGSNPSLSAGRGLTAECCKAFFYYQYDVRGYRQLIKIPRSE